MIQGLDLACGSPEERPPAVPGGLHFAEMDLTYGQQCFLAPPRAQSQGHHLAYGCPGDPRHPPRLTACLLSVYSLWLLLPLRELEERLGAGPGQTVGWCFGLSWWYCGVVMGWLGVV